MLRRAAPCCAVLRLRRTKIMMLQLCQAEQVAKVQRAASTPAPRGLRLLPPHQQCLEGFEERLG